ncbi:MAG TPA: GDSL-type esterase/lipase family protein [Lacunisphaera sp.]|nr:GDSL-type esterase/lipase family protein [Lacunisphaera sp.]
MKRPAIPKGRRTGAWRGVLAGATVALAVASPGSTVPADNPAIVYEGRYAAVAGGGIRLGFPGVTAHLRFAGPGLVLRADAANAEQYFDVAVDGAPPTVLRLHAGEGAYVLVPAGKPAEHHVALTRRNESWQGTVTLLDFDAGEGGALRPAPALPGRKLMFIGDSVTAGAMTAWTPGHENRDAAINSNGRLSYGMLLAREFGAQCHLVSYGGRGIIRDWQGIRKTNNAPQFYELALPDDPAARWDQARYVPDAIGIQLGTNDFSPGIPDEVEFVGAYVEFLAKVRRDAPSAFIFIMDSPIVNDEPGKPRRTVLHAYLEEIVARVNDPRVRLAPLPHYPGVPGNGHPSAAEHVAMAMELAPLFKAALGW